MKNRRSRRSLISRAWPAGALAALAAACSGSGPTQSASQSPSPSTIGGGSHATVSARGARIDPLQISEQVRVTLAGNTHPRATVDNDVGRVEETLPLEHMQLVLKRSTDDEARVQADIDALHDKTSPTYQQWLTAQQFGDRYGVSPDDIATLSRWLESFGMRVDHVPSSRMFIEFSATAAQVQRAFHTEIHYLDVDGERHFANMSDPQIPAALADVVVGVHAIHDFKPHPMHTTASPTKRDPATGQWSPTGATPAFTVNNGTTYYAVAPPDFATIYNLNPLFAEGITGLGQTVVVIEDTLIKNTSDVATFRAAFGLSGYTGTFSQVTATGTAATCANSGVDTTDQGAEFEAALDAEWAGATAPDAAIELASCADTTTVFGGLIALQNLISTATPPPIVSISYGFCEANNLAAGNASYASTYQQAAMEGVSVYVSAGDEGAASCDANKRVATLGIAVSGFASTPYNVAVGGTDFMDTYDSLKSGPAVTTYWSAMNSGTFSSALSYVPEIPWNNSCAGKLLYTLEGATQPYGAGGFCNTTTGKNFRTTAAGSGGPSSYSAQPSWQTGVVGLPTKSGGMRYLPDVSLFAANGLWSHFYIACMTDTTGSAGGGPCTYTNAADTVALAAGGTSFSSPALAGIQALINQKMGGAQGNPNYTFYKLGAAEQGPRGSTRCNSSGGTTAAPVLPRPECVFNDVTSGDIDVNCTTTNCFGVAGASQGALSSSTTAFAPAYAAGTGWDFATGLGTVNAYNLVNAWSN